MDTRPIAIFDSGVGGLTAVKTMQEIAPNERIVYFGDTARVPYGNRTKANITELSLQDVRFLCTHNPKAVLIACNTITANSIDDLRAAHPGLPIMGTVEPSTQAAIKATRNKKVGIIATDATVKSGAYEDCLKKNLPEVEVMAVGCPKLVPLIESGHIDLGDPNLESALAEYLAPIKEWGADTLIMGCTHYPLIAPSIQAYMGENVSLVNSGGESAKSLLKELADKDKLAQNSAAFYCSARRQDFSSIARIFLNKDVSDCVKEINIEAY